MRSTHLNCGTTLSFLPPSSRLQDSNGKSDPYVKVIANGKVLHKTETKMKTLNPKYDSKKETVLVPNQSAVKFIYIECWDWDRVGSDDFMGEAAIDVSDLEVGKEKVGPSITAPLTLLGARAQTGSG